MDFPADERLTDTGLKDSVLAGLAGAAELERRFRKPLERLLVGRCGRGDGRSQEKAVEIVGEVLAECYAKSPSLLEKWQGTDNLEAFLRQVAVRRLMHWWDSAEQRRVEVDSGARVMETHAEENAETVSGEEMELARTALREGVAVAAREGAEGLVFMRLKGIYGVEQRALAKCWQHHESQTSRRIAEAMNRIREAAGEAARRQGHELTLDQAQAALQWDASILLGQAVPGVPDRGWEKLLRDLAEGGAGAEQRGEAVRLMQADPQALAYFAALLNRGAATEPVVVRDPALTGAGARLQECVRRSLTALPPAELGGLMDAAMHGYFQSLIDRVGAVEGTLWLATPGEAVLTAAFNPRQPEMAGRRQPLASGLVSLVFVTGEAVNVSRVATDARHSPLIDLALGRETAAMMAVPFVLDSQLCGALTAVRFEEAEAAFGGQALAWFEEGSALLGELLTARLTARILRE